MTSIYLASSWRNDYQPEVLAALRAAGHEVYDFRNPAPGVSGFAWDAIDPAWLGWTPEGFVGALGTQIAADGYRNDWDAMERSEVGVLLLPCGRSAHIEAGYFVGHPEKRLHILMPELPEPELMYLMADGIHLTAEDLLLALEG